LNIAPQPPGLSKAGYIGWFFAVAQKTKRAEQLSPFRAS
jgi:hypothetical protein